MDGRPNIILLSVDELTYTALSCMENPWLHTPNMDELLDRGVSFEKAYSTNPGFALRPVPVGRPG